MKKNLILITAAATVALVLGGAGAGAAIADTSDDPNDDRNLSGTTLDRASDAALAEVGSGTVTDAETSDDLSPASEYEVEVTLAAGQETDVLLDGSFAVVRVDEDQADDTDDADADADDPSDDADDADDADSNDSDDSAPLTDADRRSASQAALTAVSSGTVTDIDRSDEADHAFEVEVTLASGEDRDVDLDASFGVVHVDTED